MKKRFTDEQIISILSEEEVSTCELCCKHVISDATFYILRKNVPAWLWSARFTSPLSATTAIAFTVACGGFQEFIY